MTDTITRTATVEFIGRIIDITVHQIMTSPSRQIIYIYVAATDATVGYGSTFADAVVALLNKLPPSPAPFSPDPPTRRYTQGNRCNYCGHYAPHSTIAGPAPEDIVNDASLHCEQCHDGVCVPPDQRNLLQ